jgi:hypothetical protein
MQEDDMTMTASTLDELTLNIKEEIRVNAPLEATFAAVLEELGPAQPTARRNADADDDRGEAWRPLVSRSRS